jgi:hypothetical protein
VSISSVVRFRRLHRETGSVSSAKFGGYKGYALAAHEELVRELVRPRPRKPTQYSLPCVLVLAARGVPERTIMINIAQTRFQRGP